MSDDNCACCDGRGDPRTGIDDATTDRWLGGESVLDARLPADVRGALGRLVGEDGVETLADWVEAVRRRTAGAAVGVEDLCHADGETPHRGELDGETYHFQCFYDAVVLAALAADPVDVRTESPDGTVIEARASGTGDLSVTPGTAVFSFGVASSVTPPADGGPTHADVYAAVCPYVRAFPDRDAYERWASTVPAATVALPFDGATDAATALVE